MKYYTIQDIMKKYNCCYNAVYDWIKSGKLYAKSRYDDEAKRWKLMIPEYSIEYFEQYMYGRILRFRDLSQEIDSAAREHLETLYGIRADLNCEIKKYEDILAIIKMEETF